MFGDVAVLGRRTADRASHGGVHAGDALPTDWVDTRRNHERTFSVGFEADGAFDLRAAALAVLFLSTQMSISARTGREYACNTGE